MILWMLSHGYLIQCSIKYFKLNYLRHIITELQCPFLHINSLKFGLDEVNFFFCLSSTVKMGFALLLGIG